MIEKIGTPIIIPTIPNKPPKISNENNTQKLLKPVLLPSIFGPRTLPSNCCKTKINIKNGMQLTGSTSSINAAAGTGMAGQVASVAANVWSEDNVAVFHQLIAATRDFNENKVDPMLRNYEGMGQEAVSTYQA